MRWASAAVATVALAIVGRRVARAALTVRPWRKPRERCPECRRIRHEAAGAGRCAETNLVATIAEQMRTPRGRIAATATLALDGAVPDGPRWTLDALPISPAPAAAGGDGSSDGDASRPIQCETTAFAFRESLGSMLKSVAWRAHRKGLDLAYEVGGSVPEMLRGDLRGFRRSLLTLVGNAIDFTAEGEVTVQVGAAFGAERGIELHVAVGDTGVGMSAETERALAARLSGNGGDGVNARRGGSDLDRVAACVRRAGGRLWIETTDGHGSVFHFTARFDVAARAAVLEPDVAACGRDVAVLVVEAHPTTRRVLVETLSGWGMRPAAVEGAALAQAAIDSARNAGRPFEIVLIDERIEGMHGATLAERLRCDANFQGALIGLLDGDGAIGGAARWRELGAIGCLMKPVTPAELWRSISAAMTTAGVAANASAVVATPSAAIAADETVTPFDAMPRPAAGVLS